VAMILQRALMFALVAFGRVLRTATTK